MSSIYGIYFLSLFSVPMFLAIILNCKKNRLENDIVIKEAKYIFGIIYNIFKTLLLIFFIQTILSGKTEQYNIKIMFITSIYYSLMIGIFVFVNYFSTRCFKFRYCITNFLDKLIKFTKENFALNLIFIVLIIYVRTNNELTVGLIGTYFFFALTSIYDDYKKAKSERVGEYKKIYIFVQSLLNVSLVLSFTSIEKFIKFFLEGTAIYINYLDITYSLLLILVILINSFIPNIESDIKKIIDRIDNKINLRKKYAIINCRGVNMEIVTKAKEFAIQAHKGQIRKSDPEKPMIIHSINVGNILKEYGFDENVIAAGFLHDVIEDTKYTKEDINKIFKEDITSLVLGASEPDKSLSWEERKQHTINEIKKLDLRHKAVVCADKISNLEDLRIISEIKGEYNFDAFKRGFEKQKWYYKEVYNSLIENEDETLPMFIKLKELIDHIFNNIKKDNYTKNNIFKDNQDEYKKLLQLHYKKEEIFKLKNVLSKQTPYIIEFTGTPRTGKTSLINNLYDFFKKKGFNVEVLEEFTTSKKYKKEIYPLLKDKYKNVVNTEIPKYVHKQLEEAIAKNPDIIIIDRSLFDRLIWVDRLFLKEGMSKEEYQEYKKLYIPLIKEKINIIISTYTDSLTSLKRDYNANLSLEKRNFLNETNVNEYNKSLLNMQSLAQKENINFHLFDTTNKNQREISFEVAQIILSDMRKEFINKVNKEFK